MAWLPDGEKISKICLFVLTQLMNVTDGQTHRQTDRHRMPAHTALMHSIAQKKMTDFYGRGYVTLRILIVGNCVVLHIKTWHKA